MPQTIPLNGREYILPTSNDVDWGASMAAWMRDITAYVEDFEISSILDFEAVGDGLADDTAAFNSVTGDEVYIPPGTYIISGNVTFTAFVRMAKGALIQIASTKTVTFNGGFEAPIGRAFSGSGSVVFSRRFLQEGYPEWWGAVTASGSSATQILNLASLNAAEAALPIVRLQSADYWISDTWKIDTARVQIRGVNQSRPLAASESRTRIIVASATADCVQIGPDADPGSVNAFAAHIELSGVELTRSVAPNAAASQASSPAGLRMKFCIYAKVDRVWSAENSIGFGISGTVQSRLTQCFAFRDNAGGGANPDHFWGYWIDGSASIGLAGGNGSTYITASTASMGGAPSATGGAPIDSYGFYLNNKFVDTFIDHCETSACQVGFFCGGVAGQNGNCDTRFMGCIADTFTERGYYMLNLGVTAAVKVIGCYAGATTGATACYEVRGSGGIVHLVSNEAICHSAVNTIGTYIHSSSGVCSSNIISGSQRPVALDASSGCRATDSINASTENTLTPIQGAVWVNDCDRCYVAPMMKNGNTNKYPKGIQVISTTSDFCEFNLSGIDIAGLTGGLSANKLSINAVDIVATGISGTHLVSGVVL